MNLCSEVYISIFKNLIRNQTNFVRLFFCLWLFWSQSIWSIYVWNISFGSLVFRTMKLKTKTKVFVMEGCGSFFFVRFATLANKSVTFEREQKFWWNVWEWERSIVWSIWTMKVQWKKLSKQWAKILIKQHRHTINDYLIAIKLFQERKNKLLQKNYGDNIGERKKWREPKLESKNKLMIGERKSETIICVDDDDDDDDNEKNRWPKQNR